MSIGLIGKKIGMTRIFTETGEAIAVTVIDVSENVFLQKKTQEKDGYSAVQIAFDNQKESRLTKPLNGHFKANGSVPEASDPRVPPGIRRAACPRGIIPVSGFSKRASGST
jgi:large subunit ribosomal protein L3